MKINDRSITVRWRFTRSHHWPEAPARRIYLRYLHRHEFHAELECAVGHNDREIEFHDLQQHMIDAVPAIMEMDSRSSCEDFAETFLTHFAERWPNRRVAISIFEDGENGATLTGVS